MMNEQRTVYEYLSRNDILNDGIVRCLRLLYDDSYPKIDENNYDAIIKKINEIHETLQTNYRTPVTFKGKNETEYMYPHDFFYCPSDYQINVLNNFTEAYGVDRKWEPYIDTLIDYLENEDGTACTEVYEKDDNGLSRKTYKHIQKLCDSLNDILAKYKIHDDTLLEDITDKVFEHIDLCKKFYKYGLPEENHFRSSIVFRSPSSNRKQVIDAWKQVFNEDIVLPPDSTWVDEYEEYDDDVQNDVDLEKEVNL